MTTQHYDEEALKRKIEILNGWIEPINKKMEKLRKRVQPLIEMQRAATWKLLKAKSDREFEEVEARIKCEEYVQAVQRLLQQAQSLARRKEKLRQYQLSRTKKEHNSDK